jgi:hypothetical protein
LPAACAAVVAPAGVDTRISTAVRWRALIVLAAGMFATGTDAFVIGGTLPGGGSESPAAGLVTKGNRLRRAQRQEG